MVVALFVIIGLYPYNLHGIAEEFRMLLKGDIHGGADWIGLALRGSAVVILLLKAYSAMRPAESGSRAPGGLPLPVPPIKLYALSTCVNCKKVKRFLIDHSIHFEFQDVDLLAGPQQDAVMEEVRKVNPRCSFPTLLIGESVIIGFREEEIRKALGMR